ncbi:DinB family protein [Maribacter algicola]|uniref:DinB family protein n=1 Tax=Meishania litoralis TaxID=3434685 RepID=A0ACC7LFN3_9FLAO
MKKILLPLLLTIGLTLNAQEVMDVLPYATIPEVPKDYTAGTVVSRMIDGLGFRYYWATEGITENDFDYRPSNEGRSIRETMEHIYALSNMIANSAKKIPNDRTVSIEVPPVQDLRKLTLQNLKTASTVFKQATDLSEHSIVFKSKEGSAEFPFWNQINGPIEDAVWHAGQLAVLRRSAGNPMDPKVNVFLGRLND